MRNEPIARPSVFTALALVVLSLLFVPPRAFAAPAAKRAATPNAGFALRYSPSDSVQAKRVGAAVERSIPRIEAFFGGRFLRRITVAVLPDRAALDSLWQVAWSAPGFHSECWMVASGTGSELDVLSPAAWKSEACEHDPDDDVRLDLLIRHELVHVYQGQHNPRPELDGMDDLGWFVEGVAVLASGQLEDSHIRPASEAIAAGKAPEALAKAWSGKWRYGVSGSLVRFVDQRVGRARLAAMLADTTQSQLLEHAGMSEADLLAEWKAREAK